MEHMWILAQAASPETSTESVAGAPASQPAAPAPAVAEKEIPAQPLEEAATTTGTQAPGGQTPAPGTERPPQPAGSGMIQLVFIVIIFAVMYFMFIRGPRKQQQQQQAMIRSLQKNDRVRTVGGIIGTVVDVKDEYITLKVDETTNTKIRVVPNAISKNLAPETKD
jgi:preprotein translocase subunit YajC